MPRSSSGTRSATSARDPGRKAAAPRPWRNRSPISHPTDSGSAKAAMAAAATTRPATINGARPTRSERRPAGYCPTNCATRLAPITTPTMAYEPPRSRRNRGRIGRTEPTPVPTRKTAAITPHSAVRCKRRSVNPVCAGFDLDEPFRVEESAHTDQRRYGFDGAEDFTMRPTNLAPAARHRREDASPGDIIEAGTHASQRLADDAQALPRLLVDVSLAH